MMPTDYSYIGDLYGNPTGLPAGYGSSALPDWNGTLGPGGPVAPPSGGGILGTGITWRDLLEFGKDAAPYVLGGVGAISAIGQQNRANDLREEALGLAREDYASRDPLRQRALSLLTGPMPQPMDLSGLRDTANPFRPMNPPQPLAGIPNFTPLPSPPSGGQQGIPGPSEYQWKGEVPVNVPDNYKFHPDSDPRRKRYATNG